MHDFSLLLWPYSALLGVGAGEEWGGWHELSVMVNRCEILIWWIHIFTQLISINVIECRGASWTEIKSNRTWTEVDLEQSEQGFNWASVQFRIWNPTELLPNSTPIQVSCYPTEPPMQLSYCPIEPRSSSKPYMTAQDSPRTYPNNHWAYAWSGSSTKSWEMNASSNVSNA